MPRRSLAKAGAAGPKVIRTDRGSLRSRAGLRKRATEIVAAGEERTEFLRSRDIGFRPVHLATGPDGALYVADMYRELIEEPMTIPEGIVKRLDLFAGNDLGRIYRVVPTAFKQGKLPRLSRATTAELVAILAHPNGWYRDTAARWFCQFARVLAQLCAMLASSHGRGGCTGQYAAHADDELGRILYLGHPRFRVFRVFRGHRKCTRLRPPQLACI